MFDTWTCVCPTCGRFGVFEVFSSYTYRIALAVFTRSPAAYEALKSYGILQLPSLSVIKQFTSANYQPAGTNFQHLQEARKSYTAYIEERVEQGLQKPMHTGVVIFDEVKVVMIASLHVHIPSMHVSACFDVCLFFVKI